MSELFLVFRVIASLAVVLGIAWFAARFAVRQGFATPAKRSALQVQSRLGLVKGAQVVVVRHGEVDLVLGVTSENVTLLRKVPVRPAADEPVGARTGEHGRRPDPDALDLEALALNAGHLDPGDRPTFSQALRIAAKKVVTKP